MKKVEFGLEFDWNLFPGYDWQKASIGSGNGLMPNRRQAITWNNADPVHWHIYVALGGDELAIYSEKNAYFRAL